MPENSLAPAFVRIEYASAYGAHTMTVPSVPLEGPNGSGKYSFDLRGAAVSVAAASAVTDYVNVLKAFFPPTVTFSGATLFAQTDPNGVAQPIEAVAFSITGTSPTGTVTPKATQGTWTFRADDFTIFKVVMLDLALSNFERGANNIAYPAGLALVAYVTDPVTWVASRGGGRPSQFLQRSYTLNEKLRRSYGMT